MLRFDGNFKIFCFILKYFVALQPVQRETTVVIQEFYTINIQGVLRIEDITATGDFLSLSDQKSSYKRVSNFGRLRS